MVVLSWIAILVQMVFIILSIGELLCPTGFPSNVWLTIVIHLFLL